EGYHALPTTAAVTRAAHRTASLGDRIFPSTGLTVLQLREAIKEYGLAPAVVPGDKVVSGRPRFSRERFCSSLSVLLSSGYPAILEVEVNGSGHAVCVVGFRPSASPAVAPGK